MRPAAAPSYFPYRHGTLAEVWAAEEAAKAAPCPEQRHERHSMEVGSRHLLAALRRAAR